MAGITRDDIRKRKELREDCMGLKCDKCYLKNTKTEHVNGCESCHSPCRLVPCSACDGAQK